MFKKFTQSEPGAEDLTVEIPERIFCSRCNALITDAGRAARIGGRHDHRRVNPAGIEYSFRCFTEAPGCRREGPHTFEHTWFRGSAWCYLICAQCSVHLGWHFQGAANFCALITDRLRYEGRC